MSQPFREAPACPHCANATLREFSKRLVCDKCEGMMIGLADFAASIHELDGMSEPVELRDGKPDKATCPRCMAAMESCTLHIGPVSLVGRVLHCAQDGVWISQAQMVAVYARVSRQVSVARGTGVGSSISAYVSVAPTGGEVAALRGIGGAFNAVDRNLTHRTPVRTHTAFVSAYRGRALACPSCKDKTLEFVGERWGCRTCKGSFAEDAAMVAMVSDIKSAPWEMPAPKGTPGKAACPVCSEPMTVEKLGTVSIDRCKSHGVWFDDAELAKVLLETSGETADHGIGSWLKRLFS